MERLLIHTSKRREFVNVTDRIRRLAGEKGWKDGALLLFSPHTTCGLTINEAADPDVARDILASLDRLAPEDGPYRHGEGNSDAHIKTSLMGSGQMVPVENGQVRLGTWQGIFLCEGDGPRRRELWVQWLPCDPVENGSPSRS